MIVINGLKMYDRKDLAELLNINEATVAKYQKKGGLRSVMVGKKKYSSEEALQDFLNGLNNPTASAGK